MRSPVWVIGIMTGILVTSLSGCSDEQTLSADASPSSSTGGSGSSSGVETGGQKQTGGSSGPASTVQSGGQTASSSSTTVTGGTSAATTSAATTKAGGSTVVSSTTAATGGNTVAGGRTATSSANGGTTASGGRAGSSSAAGGTAGSPAPRTGGAAFPAKFVGNIDQRGAIRSDFMKYWNQFSPENAGKWGSVQGNSQSQFNWNSLDTMYKFCQDNKIPFKQHCFVWGAQQPKWTDTLTATDGPAAVQNWMKTFCTRYPNTAIIDVVNEPPPHTTPKYANGIGGGTNGDWAWIANSFKWAREACPGAILVLNDYNNVELSGDAQHTSDIANAIKKLGAPIDAIGCQTHGASNSPASSLKTNLDKIASLTGLPIYITEYDIAQADDNKQKTQYQDHFTMFMNHASIKGVTIWGYVVGQTWVNNTGIMQSDGTARPALTWLMAFLNR